METPIRTAWRQALATARSARRAGDFNIAFAALERAHILSQRYLWPHVRTHLTMFRIGWLRRDWREVTGQALRVFACLPGWLAGWVPMGNSGGANVSPLRRMPLPGDLAGLLANDSVRQDMLFRATLYLASGSFLWVWR